MHLVQAALVAKISPTLAARPTGIFPGVLAAQSTPVQYALFRDGPKWPDRTVRDLVGGTKLPHTTVLFVYNRAAQTQFKKPRFYIL